MTAQRPSGLHSGPWMIVARSSPSSIQRMARSSGGTEGSTTRNPVRQDGRVSPTLGRASFSVARPLSFTNSMNSVRCGSAGSFRERNTRWRPSGDSRRSRIHSPFGTGIRCGGAVRRIRCSSFRRSSRSFRSRTTATSSVCCASNHACCFESSSSAETASATWRISPAARSYSHRSPFSAAVGDRPAAAKWRTLPSGRIRSAPSGPAAEYTARVPRSAFQTNSVPSRLHAAVVPSAERTASAPGTSRISSGVSSRSVRPSRSAANQGSSSANCPGAGDSFQRK